MFCKQLLGVHRRTTTAGVLLDLGMHPVSMNAIKASIKNWGRIKNKNANILLQESLLDATKGKLPWVTRIKHIFESNGLLGFFQTPQTNGNVKMENLVYQRLSDQFHQNSFESIKLETSKLRTYSLLKKEIGREQYLKNVYNVKHRVAMTKLRLSSHPLLIETGRYSRLDRKDRLCPLCTDKIEDKTHFMIHCPIYNKLS